MFKPEEALEASWNEHGDTDKMFWRSRYCLPITRAELEANEDAWLNSDELDEYGSCSFFIYNYYTDDEKLELWADKTRCRWRLGMRRPEPIANSTQ